MGSVEEQDIRAQWSAQLRIRARFRVLGIRSVFEDEALRLLKAASQKEGRTFDSPFEEFSLTPVNVANIFSGDGMG